MATRKTPASKSGASSRATSKARTSKRRTTTRRRTSSVLQPRRRRSRPGLPTTVGTALGTLVVTTLLDLSWPVRIGLIVLVVVVGLAYVVWKNRAEIVAGSAEPSDPSEPGDRPTRLHRGPRRHRTSRLARCCTPGQAAYPPSGRLPPVRGCPASIERAVRPQIEGAVRAPAPQPGPPPDRKSSPCTLGSP